MLLQNSLNTVPKYYRGSEMPQKT